MTTYRLPDGTVAEQAIGHTTPNGRRWVHHPTLGLILIDVNKLIEVKPPLPPEPPNGAVVLDNQRDAWQRRGDGWEMCGAADSYSWERLNETFGPLRRMSVPDPAPSAPSTSEEKAG